MPQRRHGVMGMRNALQPAHSAPPALIPTMIKAATGAEFIVPDAPLNLSRS